MRDAPFPVSDGESRVDRVVKGVEEMEDDVDVDGDFIDFEGAVGEL